MENNAIINGFRLKDLLNILDARTCVSIFTGEKQSDRVSYNNTQAVMVYELLADSYFIKTYGNRDVKGLVSFINVTNILIEEA